MADLHPVGGTMLHYGANILTVRKKANPNPKPKPIPLHLKAWRKHRGLTQEQVAERIGMTAATVSRIEKGEQNWDQEFLQAACDVLNCDPPDLLMRDPTDPEGLWTISDQLSPVERVQLVEVAKALKRTGTKG